MGGHAVCGGMHTGCCIECCECLIVRQVCVYCNGGSRPAPDGLSLPKYQLVCGEFSQDGGQASRV